MFVWQEKRSPELTTQETTLIVYKEMLVIEAITMGFGIFVSLFIGYMFEIWSRKKVLIVCFVLMGLCMLFVGLSDADTKLVHYARIFSSVFASAIMENPLLNDYVKKHDRGWAKALMFIGK